MSLTQRLVKITVFGRALIRQVDYSDGVWACVNRFECTRSCPKEIPNTKSINTIKREIQKELNKRGKNG